LSESTQERFQDKNPSKTLDRDVGAVEKVSKQILGRDAEESDLIECAMIDDLVPGRGQ
jgi:hypothetical protein